MTDWQPSAKASNLHRSGARHSAGRRAIARRGQVKKRKGHHKATLPVDSPPPASARLACARTCSPPESLPAITRGGAASRRTKGPPWLVPEAKAGHRQTGRNPSPGQCVRCHPDGRDPAAAGCEWEPEAGNKILRDRGPGLFSARRAGGNHRRRPPPARNSSIAARSWSRR